MTRVLVVDDEIDTLNLLRTILEISGYQAVTTLNSVDAITLAEVEHPDVVLLDIMMPELDGFTLCKMMRVHPATMNLPIVFVTAYSSLDLEDRRKDAGADMVLPKPIGMDTLVDAVEQATTLRPPVKAAEPAAPTPAPTPAPVPAASAPVPVAPAITPVAAPTPTPAPAAVTDTQESAKAPATDGKSATPSPVPAASAPAKPADPDLSIEIKPDSAAVPATPDKKPGDS